MRHRLVPWSAAIAAVLASTVLLPGAASAAPPGGPAAASLDDCRLERGITGDGAGEGFPLAGSAVPATGEPVKVAALYVDFSDAVGTEAGREAADAELAYSVDYLNTMAGGALDLDVVKTDGWVRMPQATTGYNLHRVGSTRADTLEYFSDAINTADPRFDFADTDVVLIVTTRNATSIDVSLRPIGMGDELPHADGAVLEDGILLGGKRRADPNLVFGHEMGHVFGLLDQYISKTSPDYDPEKGIYFTTGAWETIDGDAPEWMAWHRWMIGWLDDSEVVCVPEAMSVVARLRPVEASTTHLPGQDAMIVIPISATRGIAVESRQAIGFDSRIEYPGALIYTIDTTLATQRGPVRVVDAHPLPIAPDDPYAGLDDAPFRVGESWTHPETGTLIEIVEDEDGALKVRVRRP